VSDYPRTERFESVTVILPVMNETKSLDETVKIILRDARDKIKELLIVVCNRTIPESMATVHRLKEELGDLVVVLEQTRPFLGGALRDAFDVARGSHVIMMASDLETDPNDVKHLIAESEKNPQAIIATSRWIRKGEFHGYSTTKLFCNWVFQRFFSILYRTPLSDMTYGYRLLPTRLVQAIEWEELRHPFNLETIVKPLLLGVPATEIPSTWYARVEGESQNPFLNNFAYFGIGLRARLMGPAQILKAPVTAAATTWTRKGAGPEVPATNGTAAATKSR
jgi:glycosyltransferase involved in cell wall biosynthesis